MGAHSAETIAILSQVGAAKRGLVTGYQANPPLAKVTIQPENIETGWLPVLSQWVGAGWGIVSPLQVGDQVALMSEEADGQNYAIVGRYYSEVDVPPPVTPGSGEFLMYHQSGALLHFQTGGVITLLAGTINMGGTGGGDTTVNITGALTVSETIVAQGNITGLDCIASSTGNKLATHEHISASPGQPTSAPIAGT